MKKLLCILLACAFVSASAAAGEVELRFSWWGADARHAGTLAAIRLFEEKNPGVTIKAEYMGWNGYIERLTTQIGSASEPDVMQINWAWIDMLSHNGDGFLDLGTVKEHLNLGDYPEGGIDSGMSAGKLNALPIALTTHVFLWNKTMWDKAGAAIPKTWNDLRDAGAKFKAMGDQYYALDMEPPDGMYIALQWLHDKYGEQLVHPTEPRVGASVEHLTEAITYFRDMQASHAGVNASIRTSIAGQYDKLADQVGEFINGTWAGNFVFDAQLYQRTIAAERDFGMDMILGPMLTHDGKNPKPDHIGRPNMMFAASKHTKHPEIAAKFIAFLLTDAEAAKVMGEHGLIRGLPMAKTPYRVLVDMGAVTEIEKECVAQLEGCKFVYINPLLEHERFWLMLKDQYEAVSYGKISPAEAAEYIATEGQSILDRLARRR